MAPSYKLLDTAPLRDQRTMVDVTHPAGAHQTVQDVEEAWERWADREGLPIRRRQGDFSTDLKTSRKTVEVYISGGKWLGNCPNCNGGIPGWPNHPRGCCLDCGTIFQLDYPPEAETLELAKLMSARDEIDRNYFRHLGETLDDVRATQPVFEQAASAPGGLVDLVTLRETLSPEAFDELVKAGIA